uniref:Odorant receptor n=1 Tax=Adelphocoris lineolatus TaxID=236346 RepID=A0A2I4PH76_ADELI|nr:olfactory receptor 78 [Adelphocoris lineolatus]
MSRSGRLKEEDILDGLSLRYLKVSRLWGILNHHRETGGRSKVLKAWAIGMVIAFTPLLMVTVVGPIFTEKDLEGMTVIFLNPIATVQMIFKFGIFWFHMEQQTKLLDLMRKDYLSCVPADQKAAVSEIMINAVKDANIYTFFGSRMNIITVSLWNILPVLRSEFFRLTLGISIFGTPVDHNKILGFWYPFDFDGTPGNEIVYVYEFILCIWTGFIITLLECLIAQLVVLLTGHLKAFQYLMENFRSSHDPRMDHRKLLSYVKEHQKLSRAGESICELYNFLITVQLATGLVILILGAFNFILGSGKGDVVVMIKFVVYTMYTLVEVTVYCNAGQNLETTSEDVCFAAYSCDWYEMGVDFRKTLQMMMVRSQSPIVMKAGKLYPVNLTALNNILHMAYSTSMLLYRIKVPEEKQVM